MRQKTRTKKFKRKSNRDSSEKQGGYKRFEHRSKNDHASEHERETEIYRLDSGQDSLTGPESRTSSIRSDSQKEIQYTEIAEAISKVMVTIQNVETGVTKFRTKREFFNTLSESFDGLDGVDVKGREVIVEFDEMDHSVYEDRSEVVFHSFYEAIEEYTRDRSVPVHRFLEELERRLEDVEGSRRFLDLAVVTDENEVK